MFLVESNGTSGLLSVSRWNCKPMMYSWNLLHAHVAAKPSFLICEYFCFTSVIALEMYATGHKSLLNWCCQSTHLIHKLKRQLIRQYSVLGCRVLGSG